MNTQILNTELLKILDKDFEGFLGFSSNISLVAERWANVIYTHTLSIVPISTTQALAKEAAKSILLGINNSGNGLALLTAAYSAYANTLASGMVGFEAVPPPLAPQFISVVPIGMGGATGKQVADFLTTLIDNWIKTGTATPIVGGATIPWV